MTHSLTRLYSVTIITLHQPHHAQGTHEVEFHEKSHQQVKSAALNTTNLVTQLVNSDLVKYCPTYGYAFFIPQQEWNANMYSVTCVIPPLIIHLLEIRSSLNPTITTLYTNQYNLCMIYLRELGNVYWHASFYYDFFELAASVDNEFLEQRRSRTHDPLIAFLKQQISMRRSFARRSDDVLVKRAKRQSAAALSTCPFVEPELGTIDANQQTLNTISITETDEQDGTIVASSEKTNEAEKEYLTGTDGLDSSEEVHHQYGSLTGANILNVTADEDLQFEEWLKGYGTFQNIFPSA